MGGEYKTIWKGSPSYETKKPWGSEVTVGTLNTIHAKILFLEEGTSTSLKYYTQKNEILYVKKGKIKVKYDSEKFHWSGASNRKLKEMMLVEGDVLYVQSGCPYQIFAEEFTELIEIGDKAVDKPIKLNPKEI